MRTIRHSEADALVDRNVAALVRSPGQEGRPSKSLTVDQARALVEVAASRLRSKDEAGGADAQPYRLHAYVVLLLMTGISAHCPAMRASPRLARVRGEGDPVGEPHSAPADASPADQLAALMGRIV